MVSIVENIRYIKGVNKYKKRTPIELLLLKIAHIIDNMFYMTDKKVLQILKLRKEILTGPADF